MASKVRVLPSPPTCFA